MTNRQIARYIKAFKRTRQEWIDILIKSPDGNAAATIVTINAKIELLRSMWNWNDEEIEMP